MERKVSFPIPYPEPNNQSPPYPIQFFNIHFNSILLLRFLSSELLFPSGLSTEYFYAFLFSPTRTKYPTPRHATPHPLIFLDFVVVTSSMKAVLFHIL